MAEDGCIRDMAFQNLNLKGNLEITGNNPQEFDFIKDR